MESEIDLSKQKIELLENSLREFTSNKHANYDDTYEAVLREEFELMRKNYEKIVSNLQA